MIRKNQITVNLITNILAMSISMLISLGITPYLISKMGVAAYGYIGLIGNLIAFMAVITYTLNSMVARFLTVSRQQHGPLEASKYMSTALFTSLLIGLLLVPLIIILTTYLDGFIALQKEFAEDVKIAFLLSGLAFILTSVSLVFSTGAYSINRLDITNGINIFSNIVRVIVLVVIFSFFHAKIWHVAVVTVLQILITIVLGAISFRRLLPDIHFDIRLFQPKKSLELLSSGFFNSIIILGNTFLTQIDLIVGNRYLSAEIVGLYAAILLIPNAIRNIAAALSYAFSPTTIMLYSNGNMQELTKYSNKVVSFCGLLIGWPVAITSGLAIPILKIWLGIDYSAYEYTILLILLPLTVNLAVSQLYIVQQATNKVKIPAFASILLGGINLVLAIFFTAKLKMGVLGIVLSGIITSTVRTFIFIPIYTAIITNQPIFTYYKGIIIPLFISSATCMVAIIIQKYIIIDSLLSILYVTVVLSIFYLTVAVSLLSHENREMILQRISSLILRRAF